MNSIIKILILLSAVVLPAAYVMAAESRPNIVFIYTDDQAPTATGFMGNPQLKTPHIDRIASEGATLTNAFTTTPVCSPSRASLISSRYSSELQIPDWIRPEDTTLGIDPQLVTWMEVLQDAGYATGLFGKWHLGTAKEFHPTRHGYDVFAGFLDGGRPTRDAVLEIDGKDMQTEGFIVDVVTDCALDFLKKQTADQPFLISLHYREPHAAWLPASDADWLPYKDLDIILPQPLHPELLVDRVSQDTREYYASVASVDRNVGRVLAALDEAGFADNTIVVFTSDHGYHNGHHGLWFKGNAQWRTKTFPPQRWDNIPSKQRPNLFDQALRVPTAVRWPQKIKPGSIVSHTVSNLDWFPTLLDAAHVNAPESTVIRGNSVLPLLRGDQVEWDDNLYAEYSMRHGATTDMRAIRTPDWKLMIDFANKDRVELYDLKNDPNETKDLAHSDDPQVITVREKLTGMIKQHMTDVGDPVLNHSR